MLSLFPLLLTLREEEAAVCGRVTPDRTWISRSFKVSAGWFSFSTTTVPSFLSAFLGLTAPFLLLFCMFVGDMAWVVIWVAPVVLIYIDGCLLWLLEAPLGLDTLLPDALLLLFCGFSSFLKVTRVLGLIGWTVSFTIEDYFLCSMTFVCALFLALEYPVEWFCKWFWFTESTINGSLTIYSWWWLAKRGPIILDALNMNLDSSSFVITSS
jgi:hypothetical protein